MIGVILAVLVARHAFASVKDIDFRNFTSPAFAGLASVHLRNGDYCSPPNDGTCVTLGQVAFGDLTGDGKPEAAITLAAVFHFGNGSHSTGFVYTLVDGYPRLIGRFAGGDRKNGGIGIVRIQDQRLLVSRGHGNGATEEDIFQWNGRHLVLVSSVVHEDDD